MIRRGMSLLEVILALAILGVSLGVIGQLIRLGTTSGEKARNDTEAQLIAESLINEIAAGAQGPDPVVDQQVDQLGEWLYTVETQPIDEAGLLAVRVSVRRADETVTPGVMTRQFSFTRWIVDPGFELQARDTEAAMQAEADARKNAEASGTTSGDAASGNSSPMGNSNNAQGQNNGTNGGANPANALPMPDGNPVPPGFNPGGRPNAGGRNPGENNGPRRGGGRNGGGRGSRGGGP